MWCVRSIVERRIQASIRHSLGYMGERKPNYTGNKPSEDAMKSTAEISPSTPNQERAKKE